MQGERFEIRMPHGAHNLAAVRREFPWRAAIWLSVGLGGTSYAKLRCGVELPTHGPLLLPTNDDPNSGANASGSCWL